MNDDTWGINNNKTWTNITLTDIPAPHTPAIDINQSMSAAVTNDHQLPLGLKLHLRLCDTKEESSLLTD